MNEGARSLKAWRISRSKSQFAVALATEIAPSLISKYENGTAVPGRRNSIALQLLADIEPTAWDALIEPPAPEAS